MRIGGINGSTTIGSMTRRGSAARSAPEASADESRALMVIEPPAPSDRLYVPARHPEAPFLAQLIATQMQIPQTRAHWRAEPEIASASYAATGALQPGAPLRAFKRA